MGSPIADRLPASHSRLSDECAVHVISRPGLREAYGVKRMVATFLDWGGHPGDGRTIDGGDQQPFDWPGGSFGCSPLRRNFVWINRRPRHALSDTEMRYVCSSHSVLRQSLTDRRLSVLSFLR